MTALFVLKIIIEHINLKRSKWMWMWMWKQTRANANESESDEERKNGGANQSKSGRKEGREQESGEFTEKSAKSPSEWLTEWVRKARVYV